MSDRSFVFIVVDNKVPGDPPEALASWEGGVLICKCINTGYLVITK